MSIFQIAYILFILSSSVYATWFDAIPRKITQPDGQKIECFVSGDQYARRLHDENNYTIVHNNKDGYYYYAEKNENDALVPSDFKLGSVIPSNLNITPGLKISQNDYLERKSFIKILMETERIEMHQVQVKLVRLTYLSGLLTILIFLNPDHITMRFFKQKKMSLR